MLQKIKRFTYTYNDWKIMGGKLVDMKLAEQRAKTCLECPKNQPMIECKRCQRWIKNFGEMLFHITEGRKTKYDDQLQSCEVCGCVNQIQIHIPLKHLETELEYPKNCWKLTEQNHQ